MFTRSEILIAFLTGAFIWPVAAPFAAEPEGPKTFVVEAAMGPYDWYESGLGVGVDLDGDILVGGDRDEGIEIYRRNAEGEWIGEGRYRAPDETFEWCCDFDFCWACDPDGSVDSFGSAVAVSGKRVVVGAPGNDVNGNDAGAAYVFARRKNGTWRLEQRLDPPGPRPDDGFGCAVSIEERRILVGASGADDGAGAVYEFALRRGTWVGAQSFGVSGSLGFGRDLALDGNQVLVASDNAAYVFERPSGSWVESETLDVEVEGCGTPNCVALDGDLAAVRAEKADGAVAAFRKVSGIWSRIQTVTSPGPSEFSEFGKALDLAGHVLVIGDPQGGDEENGSAYVYDFGNGAWVYRETLEEGDWLYGAGFGSAIALDNEQLAVSAPADHYGDGVVYIFVDTPTMDEMNIDVLPWSTRNLIDPTSTRLVPVAMHGADTFDALQTDLRSLRLMPGDAPARNYRVMDVNRDGFMDMVSYYRSRDLNIPCGESQLELTGSTHQGIEMHGADTVTNARCR